MIEITDQTLPDIFGDIEKIIERIERTIASYFTRNNVSFLSDSNSDNVVIKVGSFKEDKITKLTMSSKDPVYKCKRDVLVSFETIDLLNLEPTEVFTEQSSAFSETMFTGNEIFKTMAFAAPELSN